MSERGQDADFGAEGEKLVPAPWFARRELMGLFVILLICYLVGGIGGMVTGPEIAGWYAGLVKPSWTPPGWIFGPVWGVLYLMIGVSGWLIWRRRNVEDVRGLLVLFGVQLVLNCLWSVLFFGMRSPGLALAEIVALWGVIWMMVLMFRRRSGVAGGLLIPYLLWVGFAGVLNMRIWVLNG